VIVYRSPGGFSRGLSGAVDGDNFKQRDDPATHGPGVSQLDRVDHGRPRSAAGARRGGMSSNSRTGGWEDEELNIFYSNIHLWTCWALLALLAVHISGALYHGFRNDGVVGRMLHL
jgi:hypothetical protein